MKIFQKYNSLYAPMRYRTFGNSVADISILGQLHSYLEFKGEKYQNSFILTDENDCPNLLSHGATFRMDVQGENVPHFSKINGDKSGSKNASNLFQILGDIWKRQLTMHSHHKPLIQDPEPESSFRTTTDQHR